MRANRWGLPGLLVLVPALCRAAPPTPTADASASDRPEIDGSADAAAAPEVAPAPKRLCHAFVAGLVITSGEAGLVDSTIKRRIRETMEVVVHTWGTSPRLGDDLATAACRQKAFETCEAAPGTSACRFAVRRGPAPIWDEAEVVALAAPEPAKAPRKKRTAARKKKPAPKKKLTPGKN